MKLWAIVPELILAGGGMVLVPVAGWVGPKKRWVPSLLGMFILLSSMLASARMVGWPSLTVFHGTYAVDGLGTITKLLLELGALITLLTLHSYFRGREQMAHAPMMVIFTTLGAAGLACCLDLGLLVLFLQMLSLASYLLVGLIRTDPKGNEATIKYFIYAAMALAIMAYGLTFLYGLTGSLAMKTIGGALGSKDGLWVALALAMVLVGYGFEMALVPFHFWAPDVFQGATAPVSGFISVVPKIAAFVGLLRFGLTAAADAPLDWTVILAVIAALSMTFGNLLALRQSSMKRLLAYSSIAQAGYTLMGVAAAGRGVEGANAAITYYLATFLFMNLGAFLVIAQVERSLGTDSLAALRGLSRRAPFAAAVLAFSLLSLAGIPPLAGFAGKVFLLKATIQADLLWLAVLAVMNFTVSLFYYVAVVGEMYFKAIPDSNPLASAPGYGIAAALCLTGTFLLGIAPEGPWELALVASHMI